MPEPQFPQLPENNLQPAQPLDAEAENPFARVSFEAKGDKPLFAEKISGKPPL